MILTKYVPTYIKINFLSVCDMHAADWNIMLTNAFKHLYLTTSSAYILISTAQLKIIAHLSIWRVPDIMPFQSICRIFHSYQLNQSISVLRIVGCFLGFFCCFFLFFFISIERSVSILWRPWSDAAFCGVWYGSPLFAYVPQKGRFAYYDRCLETILIPMNTFGKVRHNSRIESWLGCI